MAIELARGDEVWTQDNKRLGQVHKLLHRSPAAEPANPELKLYPSYIHVVSLDIGDDYYVPTHFVADHDPQTRRVTLSVTKRTVLQKTWTRMPNFVARGYILEEALPEI